VADFALDERLGNHADDLAAGGKRGVGQFPISPTFPPPYARPMPRSASTRPSFAADVAYAGSCPGLDPHKTQSLCTMDALF
jgi:hypothetical protein